MWAEGKEKERLKKRLERGKKETEKVRREGNDDSDRG